MGDFITRAQSGHFAPTGLWIMQRGQIGVSQRWHRRAVSTPGCLAQSTIAATELISSYGLSGTAASPETAFRFTAQRTLSPLTARVKAVMRLGLARGPQARRRSCLPPRAFLRQSP